MTKAKGKAANIAVWIILGLLIVGLAGFGVDGFGGSVRTVGSVGDRDIPVQDYARALRQEMNAATQQTGQPVTFTRARELGLDRQVLAQLVTVAALENEADRLGISVSDAIVREEVLAVPGFRGLDGRFNREAYRFALQQEGWSEREFEDRIRREIARGILQAAAVGAAPVPQAFTDTVFGWFAERRDFSVIRVGRSALETPILVPDDAVLRAFHAENPDLFTLPEARRITYAWITPALLMDEVEIDEAALRELYDLRAAEFRRPERRLVERLVFSTQDAADAAMARLAAGEASFEEVVAERGLALEDTDMGDVTAEALGAAGEGVFALTEPGVAGPFPSPFGPAIFRVNAILAAQETAFEEVTDELREQIALDRARRLIADVFDDLEDLLAGGATLEELARDTVLELGRIDLRPDTREGIAAYEDFRTAAGAATEGSFPEVLALEDGGVFALRLDEILAPQVQPFEQVQIRVIEAWDAAEAEARVTERAEKWRAALDAGESPEDLGLAPDRIEGITRTGFLPDLPRSVIATAFEMNPGERRIATVDGIAHIVTLEAVLPPDPDAVEADQQRGLIAAEARATLTEDIFTAYARQLEREAGISIDSAAIEAVHATFR